ncbi:MAG: translocation/assembly module TamB domain-containing protein [Deltaproteobacteria bacterium]|nr:translocation/assembly module TamB domain-containing protein [Deltaproteobacteria bacterium]
MKLVKKIFKILLISLASLLGLILLSSLAILTWPQLVINQKTLAYLADYAPQFGYKIHWNDLEIKFDSKELLHKKININFKNLEAQDLKTKNQINLKQLELGLEILFEEGKFKLLSINPLTALGEAQINLEENKNKAEETSFELPQITRPSFLKKTHLENIKVDLEKIAIYQGKKEIFLGELKLKSQRQAQQSLSKIILEAKTSQSIYLKKAQVSAILSSPSAFQKNDWILDLKGELEDQEKEEIQLSLLLKTKDKDVYHVQLEPDFKLKSLQGKFKIQGQLAQKSWDLKLSGEALPTIQYLKKIKTKECHLKLNSIPKDKNKSKVQIDCPLLLTIEELELPKSAWKNSIKVPQEAKINLKSEFQSSFLPKLQEPIQGFLELELTSIQQDLMSLEGKTHTNFNGIPNQYPLHWNIESTADLKIILEDFQKLKKILDHTSIAIWAPANALQGKAELNIKGKIDLAKQKGEIPISFQTRLYSKEQKLNTDGEGILTYYLQEKTENNHLEMALNLKEFQLALPNIELENPPNLFQDSRFISKNNPQNKSSQTNFSYHISIRNPKDKPGFIVSNLSQKPLPIYLDLDLLPEKIQGEITMGKSKLTLFKREAEIKKMELKLAEPFENSSINTVLNIDYADYDIRITIVGSVESPNLLFESDPPLDQDQIISILIYGKAFEELNQEDVNSVQSVAQAITDRALALGSLYFLASTPIENISYDPKSKEVEARLKISSKSSITLGTRQGETQKLGFKQGIGGNWSIDTFIENDSTKENQSGGALIEWFKRY